LHRQLLAQHVALRSPKATHLLPGEHEEIWLEVTTTTLLIRNKKPSYCWESQSYYIISNSRLQCVPAARP